MSIESLHNGTNVGGSDKKVRVGLVQINNSFSGQNYLPYSVGILQAYAQTHLQHPERYDFQLPLYRRMPVAHAVEQLEGADVILFSTYVWNIRISLEVARQVKLRFPHTVIAFGGPQVPNRISDFMLQYPYVDIACHGEGEEIFVRILENLSYENWRNIPSITFRDEEGALVHTPKIERIKDLDTVPSPYLTNVFERLLAANPDERWIAIWETNRGCPFACTFCDWGSAVASKVHQFDVQRLEKEIEWFADRQIQYVFCADANFGILPRDIDIAQYAADTKRKRGYPHALSVQNTKNATERAYKVQTILAEAGLNKGVAISLQSVDPGTLRAIKRDNISSKSYEELQRRFTRDNVETYSDMILALPGETYDSFSDGVASLIEGGQHNRIQFNNLSILPNAEMGDPEYQEKYGMETVVSKVVNIHGNLDDEEEVFEEQILVVGTNSMPRQDWVKTRAFSWMAAFLYFDKVFQIPMVVLHECCGAGYREVIELFCEGDLSEFPVLHDVQELFRSEARRIQEGGPEYVQSKEWLNIWWPADEYAMIKLVVNNDLEAFYEQSERLLGRFLQSHFMELPAQLLRESIRLNNCLIKRPFQSTDLDLDLDYNIFEFYKSVLRGAPIALEKKPNRYHIDRTKEMWSTLEAWCREVIWWGNKKGAYLYGTRSSSFELAGHF